LCPHAPDDLPGPDVGDLRTDLRHLADLLVAPAFDRIPEGDSPFEKQAAVVVPPLGEVGDRFRFLISRRLGARGDAGVEGLQPDLVRLQGSLFVLPDPDLPQSLESYDLSHEQSSSRTRSSTTTTLLPDLSIT
jgi:hypothetical protein